MSAPPIRRKGCQAKECHRMFMIYSFACRYPHSILFSTHMSVLLPSFRPGSKMFEAQDRQPNRRTIFHSVRLNGDAYSFQPVHHIFRPRHSTSFPVPIFMVRTGFRIDPVDSCGGWKSLNSVLLNSQEVQTTGLAARSKAGRWRHVTQCFYSPLLRS
jgi:hypothetical protein